MKTQKKASSKAQAFCAKISGTDVPKSTTWETCTDIIAQQFEYTYEIYTHCKKFGDNTIISIYKGTDEHPTELLEKISLPNSEVFFENEGDWDWPCIYKNVTEYFMKNWRALSKGTKKKKTKKVQVDPKELEARVAELRKLIRSATGKEKKALIQEYNVKSVQLEEIRTAAEEQQVAQDAQKQTKDLALAELKKKKTRLYHKIKSWQSKGKDTAEMERELAEINKQLSKLKK